MDKNKVVVFDKTGRARVFITDQPDLIQVHDGETKLVNPELSFVENIPPELWELVPDGKVMPIFDPEKTKQRMANLNIRSFTNKIDDDIKKDIHNLVSIPKKLDEVRAHHKEQDDVSSFRHLELTETIQKLYQWQMENNQLYYHKTKEAIESVMGDNQNKFNYIKTLLWWNFLIVLATLALLGVLVFHR